MHLLIDGMNVAYKSWSVFDKKAGLATQSGLPTGTTYGFCQTMTKWYEEYPQAQFHVAWEDPSSNWRKEENEDYKSNRNTDHGLDGFKLQHDPFFMQISILQDVLEALGVDQYAAKSHEADDVIATLCDRYEDQPVIIVSSDHDFLQLVDDSTAVQTPNRKKSWDSEDVRESYHGVDPENFSLYRALAGDDSDNLPGLPYFRRKVIAQLVDESEGTLESLYNLDFSDLTDKESSKLDEFEEQAYTNYRLMNLTPLDSYDHRPANPSPPWIEFYCDELELDSFRNDLRAMASGGEGFMKTS